MKIKLIKALFFCFLISSGAIQASVEQAFSPQNKTQKILDIESALARAQAKLNIIPNWAAEELTLKAQAKFVTQEELKNEYAKVRHRMVAFLNVWSAKIDHGAEEYMHFGATTVDIYDTTLVLQLLDALEIMLREMVIIEDILIELAVKHKQTVMIGRTLGQHALPITFGKKVATWLGENNRNIHRLQSVKQKLSRSSILKGAVGSYLGLGDSAIELEQEFAKQLGLNVPYADDWHGSRDVFAEYALTLSLVSKSFGRIGNELFTLQMTDIAETEEIRRSSSVGSSTMPHKKNPSKSEALIFYARTIPRMAEVVLDDMVNVFERDNTSRTNAHVGRLSIEFADMLKAANGLLSNLKVKPDNMKSNLAKTQGLVMSQRVVFYLASHIGKTTANEELHRLAKVALEQKVPLRVLLENDEKLGRYFTTQKLDELFDPTTYVGLASEQVEAVIEVIEKRRNKS